MQLAARQTKQLRIYQQWWVCQQGRYQAVRGFSYHVASGKDETPLRLKVATRQRSSNVLLEPTPGSSTLLWTTFKAYVNGNREVGAGL